MYPETGSFTRKQLFRSLILFAVVLISACDDDKPDNKQDATAAPATEPLPVKEWYPTPRHQQAPRGFAQSPAPAVTQARMPAHYGAQAVQQPWTGVPQVVYIYPQVAGQPQLHNSMSPWQYSVPQPVVPQPYPAAPAYQYAHQPWGLPPVTINNHNPGTNTSGNAWQQTGSVPQWGSPATNNYPGWGPGQYGVAPDVNTSGYVW